MSFANKKKLSRRQEETAMYDSSANSLPGKRLRSESSAELDKDTIESKRQRYEDSLNEAAETFLLARDHTLPANNAI